MDKILKPCPFCGGEAGMSHGVEVKNGFSQFCFIACEKCGGRTRRFYRWYDGDDFERSAIEAWNTRKPIDEIIEQLKDKNITAVDAAIIFDGDYFNGLVDGLEEAIKIVKGGKVDA